MVRWAGRRSASATALDMFVIDLLAVQREICRIDVVRMTGDCCAVEQQANPTACPLSEKGTQVPIEHAAGLVATWPHSNSLVEQFCAVLGVDSVGAGIEWVEGRFPLEQPKGSVKRAAHRPGSPEEWSCKARCGQGGGSQ